MARSSGRCIVALVSLYGTRTVATESNPDTPDAGVSKENADDSAPVTPEPTRDLSVCTRIFDRIDDLANQWVELNPGRAPLANLPSRDAFLRVCGQLPDDAQIVGLCDCNLPRAADFAREKQAKWPICQDYRTLLERKDVDAVIVATGEFQRVRRVAVQVVDISAGHDVNQDPAPALAIERGGHAIRNRRTNQAGPHSYQKLKPLRHRRQP